MPPIKQVGHIRRYKSGKIGVVNPSNSRILRDIKSFELTLPRKDHSFVWFKGGGNIILSAPHAVPHYRTGTKGMRLKIADTYTGGFVYALHNLTKMPSIILTRPGTDPNYHKTPYVSSIHRNIRGKILLLDIHGANISRPFDIALGTVNNKSLLGHADFVDTLTECFHKNNVRRVILNPHGFGAGSQQTITYFVSRYYRLPCIQIELNERYRNPVVYPNNVIRAIRSISDFINSQN